MGAHRRRALVGVSGETLEIGFGTGLNLPYYPDTVTKLMAIDANEGMRRFAMKRIRSAPLDVEFRTLDGEALPLKDETFDSVVSACTLCSIADVEKALGEARRVLKRGGKFFFLEHGLSDDIRTRKWQQRLNPAQKIIGDGCHLDRDIEGLVMESGLKIVKMEKFLLDGRLWLVPDTIRRIGQMFLGVAVKS